MQALAEHCLRVQSGAVTPPYKLPVLNSLSQAPINIHFILMTIDFGGSWGEERRDE